MFSRAENLGARKRQALTRFALPDVLTQFAQMGGQLPAIAAGLTEASVSGR